jgi:serine/threonine-protein kinase
MVLTSGTNFAGFTVLRQLGAGGMGEVYLVRHPRLSRDDALKVLPRALAQDPEYRRRFDREADAAAAL